jgi:hypothetical protein
MHNHGYILPEEAAKDKAKQQPEDWTMHFLIVLMESS